MSLKAGPQFGVIASARTSEEIRADVSDFADQLLRRADGDGSYRGAEEGQQSVPREIERAIRNMSDLRPSRKKNADGKIVRIDPAKDLAVQSGSSRELVVEILSRMQLPRRDRRETWYDSTSNMEPLEWVRDIFEKINNGRHPEFGLPAHLDLIVPGLLESAQAEVSIVDTRGIDQLTARADLEKHLLDSHTISILCSGFNDAPEQSIQHLLERARDIGNPQIKTHACLLVLARPGEALAVKDEVGLRAESDQEGYELKEEQILNVLAPFDLDAIPVEFFNSFVDDPQRLKEFIFQRITDVRCLFKNQLSDVVFNAGSLLQNLEEEQVLEVQRDASRHIKVWLESHVDPPQVAEHVYAPLMSEIRHAHASTLNAAIRREGEWYALSYSHQLGFGARRVAVVALRDWRVAFTEICENLQQTHPEASELLDQALRIMNQSYDDLLKKMQVAGAALYRAELQRSQGLWQELTAEWGLGSGYKDRISAIQEKWFSDMDACRIEKEIVGVLSREWSNAHQRLSAIFDSE